MIGYKGCQQREWRQAKEGEADAVLRRNGALVAADSSIVGRIKNIDRPGPMSTANYR